MGWKLCSPFPTVRTSHLRQQDAMVKSIPPWRTKTEANGDFNEENCPKLDRYIYIYMCVCVFMLSIVFLWTCDKQVRVLHFQSHRIPWEIRSPSADPIHPATEVAGPWLWQIWTFTPKPFWAKAARTLVLWLSLQRPSRNHRDCAWNCRIYNEYIYIYTLIWWWWCWWWWWRWWWWCWLLL